MAVIKHCGFINGVEERGFLLQPPVSGVRLRTAARFALSKCVKVCKVSWYYAILSALSSVSPSSRGRCLFAQDLLTQSYSESSWRVRALCGDRWSNGYGFLVTLWSLAVAYRGGVGVFKPPPPKFRRFDEAEPKYVVLIYQKLRKVYYMKWNFLYQIIAASRTTD
jgi:hypothetical protein